MGVFLRVIFSMALVLVAMWFATRAARRYSQGGSSSLISKFVPSPKDRREPLIESRVSLTRQTVVAVVNFEGTKLLVAASDTSTEVLARLDPKQHGGDAAADYETASATQATEDSEAAIAQAVLDSLQPVSFLDHLRNATARTTTNDSREG